MVNYGRLYGMDSYFYVSVNYVSIVENYSEIAGQLITSLLRSGSNHELARNSVTFSMPWIMSLNVID